MKRYIPLIVLVITFLVFMVFTAHRQHSFDSSYFSQRSIRSPPYVQNFLTADDFLALCADFDARLSQMKHENYENVNRQNQFVEKNSIVYNILGRPEYREKLRAHMGNSPVYLARNHPVEYRRYFPGSFMRAHRDVQLYRVPQWECILTLYNTSDSRTQFYADDPSEHSLSIRPEPNSVMFVQANGVRHEVLPIRQGERRFIKFIMTETDDRV